MTVQIGDRITFSGERGIVTRLRPDVGSGTWSVVFRVGRPSRWTTRQVAEIAMREVVSPEWEIGQKVRTLVGLSGVIEAIEKRGGRMAYGLRVDRRLKSGIQPEGLSWYGPEQIITNEDEP